jgi:hypothetical protein
MRGFYPGTGTNARVGALAHRAIGRNGRGRVALPLTGPELDPRIAAMRKSQGYFPGPLPATRGLTAGALSLIAIQLITRRRRRVPGSV